MRTDGMLPAVVYGALGSTEHVALSAKEFEKVWREAGETTVITLSGADADRAVLVQDVEVDPLYGTPVHVDLYAVKADEVVEVEVPLTFSGVAPAEKELGGTLIKVMHEIEIEALPQDLPHEITVDISSLKSFDDIIHVSDIALPDGVHARMSGDEVVAIVQAPREEAEEEAPADVTGVEVEKKGKEEEAAA